MRKSIPRGAALGTTLHTTDAAVASQAGLPSSFDDLSLKAAWLGGVARRHARRGVIVSQRALVPRIEQTLGSPAAHSAVSSRISHGLSSRTNRVTKKRPSRSLGEVRHRRRFSRVRGGRRASPPAPTTPRSWCWQMIQAEGHRTQPQGAKWPLGRPFAERRAGGSPTARGIDARPPSAPPGHRGGRSR